MADLKISALTASTTPLAGTEVLPVVQSSTTKQVSVANLTAGRAVSMLSATAGNVQVSANTVTTTDTNGNLTINPNGSGYTVISAPTNGTYVHYFDQASRSFYVKQANVTGYDNDTLIHESDSGVGQFQWKNSGGILATLSDAGNLTLPAGNLVIGTSGKGITTGSAIGLGFGVNGSVTDMSIDSSGNTFVAGRTSTATTATGSYFFATSGILAQGRTNGGDVQRFFCTDNGNQVGSVTVSTAGTAFNITSDQRLKTDLGIVTSTTVIRDTKIHDYEWKGVGVKARGVFAQEAVLVKPDAVSKGETNDLDEQGKPIHPWSVDYSKYVPDLIVYCQELERRIAALEALK
jgi:hypothetical protein